MRLLEIVLAAACIFSSGLTQEKSADRFKQVITPMVKAINAKDYAAIQADFGEVMLKAFPLEKQRPFFQSLSAGLGKITKLGKQRLFPPNKAIYPAHFERGILDITIVLDDQNKIIGLWFLPHTADIPVPDRHETELSLPFQGRWLVYWGGDTKELNQHHDAANQKFAFDFIALDKLGKDHKGEGKSNEDYYSFGKDVLSPADGVVTDVIQGVRDNVPGSMNPYSALGNAVFIQHGQLEISVLAHFKHGSIKVKVGDTVKKGQVIGLCGNSGNSSQPHLHYHLQNTPIIQDASGIKCRFEKVAVTENGKGQTKREYSPVKGSIISSK